MGLVISDKVLALIRVRVRGFIKLKREKREINFLLLTKLTNPTSKKFNVPFATHIK